PYTPSPIDTANVRVPRDIRELTELLARNAHEVWARQRMSDGWTRGPKRDDATKQHPCLIPYEELPESEKQYDRNAAMETVKAILALGYRIEKK
ncbi:MAG: RyR domain-containing protein, partial [Gemmatimonadaceae bacterium]